MNRRTFLQSATALAVIPAIPVIAKRRERPWIDFIDQMPELGQKVALCTYFNNHTGINIATGIIDRKIGPSLCGNYHYDHAMVLVELAFSYSPNEYFHAWRSTLGKPYGVDCDICLYDLAIRPRVEAQMKIHKAQWIDNDKECVYPIPCKKIYAPRHGQRKAPYIGRDRTYWFPIDDYIPQHLPTLPEPLPLILDGERNLLK